MSVDVEAPAPSPGENSARGASPRRRLAWRAIVAALVLLIAYVLYGGRVGGPSEPRQVEGALQQLTYPGSFGRAEVTQVAPGYERIQLGGFGAASGRGPRAALSRVLRMTRAGGMLFEVRGLASDGERAALLRRGPYDCQRATETERLGSIQGIELGRVRRGWLFRWLPSSVQICGTRVKDSVLLHASGFAADATYHREWRQVQAMLHGWQVDVERVPHAAQGCRMHVSHEPPLYVRFRDEALAETGLVSADTVEWIDLPYRDAGNVGRFTPAQLEEVAASCAEAQAVMAELVESGADPQSAAAQDVHHGFRARCEPLFETLRFLGADTLEPEALPRPAQGWTLQLGADYVPALCLPLASP